MGPNKIILFFSNQIRSIPEELRIVIHEYILLDPIRICVCVYVCVTSKRI